MREKFLGYLKSDMCLIKVKQKEKYKWKLKQNPSQEMDLDASSVLYYKEKKKKIEFYGHWKKKLFETYALSNNGCSINNFKTICEPRINIIEEIKYLQIPAWLIKIKITLKKPYFSRGEEPLYFVNNPIIKDPVFKVPMVRATTWKGKMRWVGIQQLVKYIIENKADSEEKINNIISRRIQLIRLFGNENRVEERFLDKFFNEINIDCQYKEEAKKFYGDRENFKGYLNFYATFFDKIDYDLINKLDDTTRTGQGPITYEIVPPEARGDFSLLYLPFDDYLKKQDCFEVYFSDLERIRLILNDLFFKYGFSAKGEKWGIVKKNCTVNIYVPEKYKDKWSENSNFSLDKKLFGGEISGGIE